MEKQLCFLLILVISEAHSAEFGDRIKNYTETWGDNLDMEESQHRGFFVPPPQRLQTEIPITFQAPYINAKNYWNDGRRTVFEYETPNPLDLLQRPFTEGINSFYGMMSQFFGRPTEETPRRPSSPLPPLPPKGFQYDQQFANYFTPKPYYLPGPKPVRATVIKLEAARPTAVYTDYTTSSKHYPQFVKLLNDVLIENAYKKQIPSYGFGDFTPVIEKPGQNHDYIAPTTYKPKYPFPNIKPTKPSSIQDQLPPVKQGQDTRIPYISETTQQTVRKPHKGRPTSGTTVIFPEEVPKSSVPALDYEIDVRNAQHPITKAPSTNKNTIESDNIATTIETPVVEIINTRNKPNIPKNHNTNFVNVDSPRKTEASQTDIKTETTTWPPETTEVPTTTETAEQTTEIVPITMSPLPPFQTEASEQQPVITTVLNTAEKLENIRHRSPFPKKIHSRKVTTDQSESADYVTDLTIKGLAGQRNYTLPRLSNLVNMTSVIGYELGKLNTTIPIPDFDDELSLDAKILRDTNWDGFQPLVPATTEPATESPTTWQPPTTLLPITTTEAPVVTTIPPETTTRSTNYDQRTEVVSTRRTQSVSRSLRPRFENRRRTTTTTATVTVSDEDTRRLPMEPPNFQETFDIGSFMSQSTTVPTIVTTRKQYRRRKKVQSFTPNPKIEEKSDKKPLHLGSLMRPFYPKRSRPNATLTFTRRLSTRVQNEETSQETEEGRKPLVAVRRNLYRQREYPSQLRRGNSTTEVPPTGSTS